MLSKSKFIYNGSKLLLNIRLEKILKDSNYLSVVNDRSTNVGSIIIVFPLWYHRQQYVMSGVE